MDEKLYCIWIVQQGNMVAEGFYYVTTKMFELFVPLIEGLYVDWNAYKPNFYCCPASGDTSHTEIQLL